MAKVVNNQYPQTLGFDYVSSEIGVVLENLKTTTAGLSEKEARERLLLYGTNEPAREKKRTIPIQILSKFLNPLVAVLIIIGIFSLLFGEKISAILISLMAIMSVMLSFIQEYRAGKEAKKLSEMVRATATVQRDGKPREIKIREIVPGDVVDLYAGDIIPADLRILSAKDLFVNQSSLTGEAFPLEKVAGPVKAKDDSPAELHNLAFMGSSVVSGTAQAVVLKTGIYTQFGELSKRIAIARVETNFDIGIRRFTWLMIRFMLVLVAVILAINVVFKGNFIEALLFSLAVAVGLTPEMLPMLVTVNLSKGAIAMSKKEVIVKRLNSIQDIGAMDILCTDKTGTLTMDRIVLEKYCDVAGKDDEEVLHFGYINSFYQTGLKNLLDLAILKHEHFAVEQFKKVDEIPFDFSRKIMSVVVNTGKGHRLIAKGAPEEIFPRCTRYELEGEILEIEPLLVRDLEEEYDQLSAAGFRVLAIAYKDENGQKQVYTKEDEKELILKGYVAFLDPPKPTTKKAIGLLKKLGVEVKILTGDNELVTRKICGEVGLEIKGLVRGAQLENMDEEELRKIAVSANIFTRMSPQQKERVIRILHQEGHTVGYLGDGVNDAPALKASDVGISVNNAVDIAKESADIILLKKSLTVLKDGVVEGRKTFSNIIKYIKMGSSSNFGNMISMTGASLFLPFLPMTPIQILLNNFLYDLSQTGIPTDEVDQEYIDRPRPWNLRAIKHFMLGIGPISSVFDFATFGVLLAVFHASQELFHTAWFLESIWTQTLVVYIIRTGKIPFIESRPSKFLVLTSLLIVGTALVLPFSPLAHSLGLVAPSAGCFLALALITFSYLITVYYGRNWFIRKYGYD